MSLSLSRALCSCHFSASRIANGSNAAPSTSEHGWRGGSRLGRNAQFDVFCCPSSEDRQRVPAFFHPLGIPQDADPRARGPRLPYLLPRLEYGFSLEKQKTQNIKSVSS